MRKAHCFSAEAGFEICVLATFFDFLVRNAQVLADGRFNWGCRGSGGCPTIARRTQSGFFVAKDGDGELRDTLC
ncbi:hypothetical protein RB5785 [Rhodopirellula baltica SH 1]|uniref:Uncharacterized protein n=1 Tax=Rhodopirellula baltica (strain DSM 10527 / NCIMB 13988 / SH1) TaxID=243090 RepID=Q7URA5_RHOBA|nr:hypothetical protein RB5785 [Rhodopirellula baltica SH 1]